MVLYTSAAHRTGAQVASMTRLGDRARRLAYLRWAANRRAVGRQEPDGLERVPVRLVRTLDGANDPVLVVPGRVIVPDEERAAAQNFLREQRLLVDDDGDLPARRVANRNQAAELRVTTAVGLPAIIERMRRSGLSASANHVAALGGRAKGGSTPEPTAETFGGHSGDAPVAEPKVIVIDSGMDRAAVGRAVAPDVNRTDGWLDSVVVHGAPASYDPLDVVDHAGTLGADGFLDLAAGHGTFVAGLIRREAPTAPVTVIRALDTDGFGSEVAIETAIDTARDLFGTAHGILNLSLGMETVDGDAPVGIRDAIAALPDNVVTVAAAGNGPTGVRMWPAALSDQNPRVIAVSSATRTDPSQTLEGSAWANFGEWVTLSVVGEGVVSTFVDGTETQGTGADGDPYDPSPDTFTGPDAYAAWSGTSFATAIVSGRLAAEMIAGNAANALQALDNLTSGMQHDAKYGFLVE